MDHGHVFASAFKPDPYLLFKCVKGLDHFNVRTCHSAQSVLHPNRPQQPSLTHRQSLTGPDLPLPPPNNEELIVIFTGPYNNNKHELITDP